MASSSPPYTEYTFDQHVDHFKADDRTFKQRFLVNDEHWDSKGPVFFYCGNEGPVESFWNNAGFIHETASEFNALVVFMEHRYYGKSMPLPGTPGKDMDMSFLSGEQALADYANFILSKRENEWQNTAAVIGFGGSYGGMLSAWLRIKYPWAIEGALAASAPVHMFPGMIDDDAYNSVVTQDYRAAGGDECVDNVRIGLSEIHDVIQTVDGRKKVSEVFHLCSSLQESQIDAYMAFVQDGIMTMAELDYPYATEFLNPLPANPVSVACASMKHDKIANIKAVIDIYYNYTGASKCYNLSTPESPSLGWASWDYQACTEMILPISSNNRTDFFIPQKFSLSELEKSCHDRWGVKPMPKLGAVRWGGENIVDFASNIVFSNGDLDPWSVGGITKATSSSGITLIEIKGGAHHLDLRGSNELDPPSVKEARLKEKECIRRWIS